MEIEYKDFERAFDLLLRDGAILIGKGDVRDLVIKYEAEMKKTKPPASNTALGAVIVSALISGHIFGKEAALKEANKQK